MESGRGRPAGATNIPTSQDTSTRREPSAFERVLSQEEPRGRGCGRGHGRVQPYNQPNGQQTPREGDRSNEPHGNARGGRPGAQRAGHRGQYEGIPGDMTGIMEF